MLAGVMLVRHDRVIACGDGATTLNRDTVLSRVVKAQLLNMLNRKLSTDCLQ